MKMNKLNTLLYNKLIGAQADLNEQQQQEINSNLAICLVYLYWTSILLLLVNLVGMALGYSMEVPIGVVALFVVLFVGFFFLFNRRLKTAITPTNLSRATLSQHLKRAGKNAVLSGIFFSVFMGVSYYFVMNFGALKSFITSLISGIFFGITMYYYNRHSLLLLLKQKAESDTDE